MPLRFRLTLVYLVLLAGSLGGLSLALYLVTASRISSSVDDKLRVQGEAVVTALEPIEGPLAWEDLRENQRLRLEKEASSGAIFQVRDLEGGAVYSSFPSGSLDLPLPEISALQQRRFVTAFIRGDRFRIQYLPLTSSDGEMVGSVVAGQSLADTDAALHLVRNILIFGGVGVLLATNALAYILAGRVLEPVRRVSRLARDIERTADFSHRVPGSAAGDEMAELTGTFNSMIERVERMLESQKAFLADSSHELRRPLTVLRTNIAVLRDPSLPVDERKVCLEEMRAEAQAMSRLLSDLLLLSREGREEIARTPVDWSALCEQAVARHRARDNQHQLMAKIGSGAWVKGDENRLRQMLQNLLENSAEYTPQGGDIEVDLRLADGLGLARLEVRDTGIGISQEDLPQIFDRFYRGEDARVVRSEGTGLGLAMVKYIVEAHGGSVGVTSELGHGTTFVVSLPLAGDERS